MTIRRDGLAGWATALALLALGALVLAPLAPTVAAFGGRTSDPATFANTTLPAPTGVTATVGNDSRTVTVTWTATTAPWATGHRVYRAASAAGPFTKIAETTNLTTTTFGEVRPPAYNFYRVTAYYLSWETAASTVGPLTTAWRINAGGGAAAPYVADTAFSGGSAYSNTNTVATAGVTNPAPQAVYQSEHYGTHTYTITGLTSGTSYLVRLHFAEIYWGPGAPGGGTGTGVRTFDVAINGTTVLPGFDIFAAAGGANRAIVREFAPTANTGGQLAITFTTLKDNAKSSGIEILPGGVAPAAAPLTRRAQVTATTVPTQTPATLTATVPTIGPTSVPRATPGAGAPPTAPTPTPSAPPATPESEPTPKPAPVAPATPARPGPPATPARQP